jgi:predicted AlkP superfamily phosphohydrolase/phosphomutase
MRLHPSRAGLALTLTALAAACDDSDPRPARVEPPHKLLVVGWDGATFEMIDPLLAQGRLPNVAKMIARGSQARCASTIVPISSAAWVGAVTGKTPGENGVYSFFEPVEASYDVRLISSRSNRASPLWRILGWNGMKSLVVGVPVTFPPERIDGVMIAGMLSPLDAAYTHPPALAQRLRERGFVPDLGAWRTQQEVSFERVEQQLALKSEIVGELMRGEAWDFAMIVFKDLDVWCHRAYDGAPQGPVARHYELLDAALGKLLEEAGPDANVVLISDHGFRAYRRSFFVHAWLVEQGYAVVRADAGAGSATARNLAERRALEHERLIASLDLERTRAWGGACEANYGGIRLNVAGREPKGALAPDRVDATLGEIAAKLRALRLPGGDRPLVTRTWRGSELYPGPYAASLPDLLFELDPSVAARPGPAPVYYGEHERHPFPDHGLDGIWIAAGPSFAQRPGRGEVAIFDLAPTALALLGLPVYREMSGRARTELLAAPAAPATIAEADDPRARAGYRPAASEYSASESEEVTSRLRELGYVE